MWRNCQNLAKPDATLSEFEPRMARITQIQNPTFRVDPRHPFHPRSKFFGSVVVVLVGTLEEFQDPIWRHGDGIDSGGVDYWLMPVLFLVGMLAGGIDAIAGGGGLLTVPALLWAGLPIPLALGTNKLQSSCGTALATWRYARAGLLRLPGIGLGAGATLVGACLGVAAVHRLNPVLLRQLVPFLLVFVAAVFWFKPQLGRQAQSARVGITGFAVVAGLALGFYDGFFGPGTGSFWMLLTVAFLGLDLRQATGWTKAMNLTSNLAALGMFLWLGQVQWRLGGAMALGQLVGAHFGSTMVLQRGQRFIRPVLLVVVLVLALKLGWDALSAR